MLISYHAKWMNAKAIQARLVHYFISIMEEPYSLFSTTEVASLSQNNNLRNVAETMILDPI